MSSLLTNTAAMTALQTLARANKNLAVTQNRISTGYRVATASDNAAYWSIATTMRSDNKALSTVQDALGLGAAQVDIAYTAMENAKDILDEIKAKLVAAKQPSVDRAKIQSEIKQYQDQLVGIASAAVFSGSNWLSVDSSASGWTGFQKVVASFSRTSSGSIEIGTIDVDLRRTALFDANATRGGILEQGQALTNNGGLQNSATVAGDGINPASVTLFTDVNTDGVTLDEDDVIKFNLVFNGEARRVIIDKATVDAALGTSDGVVADAADMVTVVQLALRNAGFDTTTDVTVSANAGAVVITHVNKTTDDTLAVTNAATSDNGNFFSVIDIDITDITDELLDEYIAGIDAMAAKVTTAASDLGAVKSRIGLQKDFVKALMDAIDRGIGQLVDADMNAESTRLQALQVQQQLAIQALSIANANSQNILALFR